MVKKKLEFRRSVMIKQQAITVAIERDVKDITLKLTVPNQRQRKNGKRKATGKARKTNREN
jgi:hypothetical protein